MDNKENLKERNLRIAKKALKRANDWIRNAEIALTEKRWNDVVYSAQMGAEQSIKGILLAMGVNYKRVHDVSVPFKLIMEEKLISDTFQKKIPQFAEWLVQLTQERHLAGYGFEEDIENNHFKEFAPQSIEKGKRIHETCQKELINIEKMITTQKKLT